MYALKITCDATEANKDFYPAHMEYLMGDQHILSCYCIFSNRRTDKYPPQDVYSFEDAVKKLTESNHLFKKKDKRAFKYQSEVEKAQDSFGFWISKVEWVEV